MDVIENIRSNPVDVPLDSSSVDTRLLTEILSLEELKRLWSGDMDITVTNEYIVTLYWNHWL